MPLEKPPQPSEALEQARAKAKRLANAFQEVFGKKANRTSSQKIVFNYLSECADDDSNSYRFNDAIDGISRIAAGIHRDGAKSILRIINRQISIASDQVPVTSKIKSKR